MPKTARQVLQQASTWTEFKQLLQPLGAKAKGDCFELLTLYYLRLHPQYATKLKKIWPLKKVPAPVRQRLKLPVLDEGIDLVAQTQEGEFWAIQCKYLEDETHSLSRRQLSTFTDLAFGVCRNFSLGLVCTSADRYSRKLKLHADRLSFVYGDSWRELDRDFFARLHRQSEGKTTPLQPLQPRPHQQRAIRNAKKHFLQEKNSRGKLIMPCGSGKSLAAYWMAEELGAKSILVAVPSLALIRQSLEVWTREAVAQGKKVNWICVCSDESVSRAEEEDTSVLMQDLGIRVHTGPSEIKHWLKAKRAGATIVFCTYQSGKALAQAARQAKFGFDLAIMDEAHKTVGRQGNLFGFLLNDKNLKIKKRIFMTATERRYLGNSDDIASMDNPDLYGETFELLSFKEALESKPPILSDYKILTLVITRDEIAELVAQNLFVRPKSGKWNKEIEAEMLAGAVALRKAMSRHSIKHAVSFHSSIARAVCFEQVQRKLTEEFPRFGKLECFHVSGQTPTFYRKQRLREFAQASRSLITNARCLTEGVDVPQIDCVLFADPRKSAVDIVQAVGRAMRPAAGKKLGYVLVPVLLDENAAGKPDSAANAYEAILTVLRALAANDERIIDYFRDRQKKRRARRHSDIVDIEVIGGQEIDVGEFTRSIELAAWSRLAKLSWRPFEEARDFAKSLRLSSNSQWRKYTKGEMPEKGKLPEDIPTQPDRTYKDKGWVGWGNWLGTGTIAPRLRQYRSFNQARKFARSLGLRNQKEWLDYTKGKLVGKGILPEDIPASPNRTYQDKGWVGLGDWLGTGTISWQFKKYRPFNQARKFVRGLGLASAAEWLKYTKGVILSKGTLPEDIPANPANTYKDRGWVGWGDWLGTGTISPRLRKYRPFKQAREFSRGLGLKSQSEWYKYTKGKLAKKAKLPEDIPANPWNTYRDNGWCGMGDWLGTGTIAVYLRKYQQFKQARKFVRTLGLKSSTEWRTFIRGELPRKGKLPKDIPLAPHHFYKDKGWISWGDWLGTGTIAYSIRKLIPFSKARAFVRSLGLKSQTEWRKYTKGEMPGRRKLPKNIPASPSQAYKDKGWTSMGDWLGKDSK